MSYIDKGIRHALDEARQSNCPTYRIGAALMKRNQVVSRGRNIFKKSHTKSRTMFNGIHAEFDCLHGIDPGKYRNCILFVARITNAGSISMARPCDGCLELLRECGIRVFYYTDYNGNVVREALE
jgi:deoxycytidylate deaminase